MEEESEVREGEEGKVEGGREGRVDGFNGGSGWDKRELSISRAHEMKLNRLLCRLDRWMGGCWAVGS